MASIQSVSSDLSEVKQNQIKIIELLEKIMNKNINEIEQASAKVITDISELINDNDKEIISHLRSIPEKPKTTSYKGLTRFSPPNLGSSEPKMEKLKDKQVLKYPLSKTNEKQELFTLFILKGKE